MIENRFTKFYRELNSDAKPAKRITKPLVAKTKPTRKKPVKAKTAEERKAIIEKNIKKIKADAKIKAKKLKRREKKRLLKKKANPVAKKWERAEKVVDPLTMITAGPYTFSTSTIQYFFKANGNAKIIFNNGRDDIIVPLEYISWADQQKIWAKLTKYSRVKRVVMHSFRH
jgi:hypothetical protein